MCGFPMDQLLHALWPYLLAVVLVLPLVVVFAVSAPEFVLRSFLRLYPEDDERRMELLAELCSLPRRARPMFVVEQVETALREGIGAPVELRLAEKTIDEETGPESAVVDLVMLLALGLFFSLISLIVAIGP